MERLHNPFSREVNTLSIVCETIQPSEMAIQGHYAYIPWKVVPTSGQSKKGLLDDHA